MGVSVLFAAVVIHMTMLVSVKAPLEGDKPSAPGLQGRPSNTVRPKSLNDTVYNQASDIVGCLKCKCEQNRESGDASRAMKLNIKEFIFHACGSDALSPEESLDCVQNLITLLTSLPDSQELEEALLKIHIRYQSEIVELRTEILESRGQLREKQLEAARLSTLQQRRTENLSRLKVDEQTAYLCVSSLFHCPLWGLFVAIASQWYLWPLCLCCICCNCYCLDQFGWVAKR